MNVDFDDFRRYYGTLSDDALLDLNPEDLTDFARQCYQAELSHRGLKPAVPPTFDEFEPGESRPVSTENQFSIEHLPWKNVAVAAAEFENVEDAEQARDVLEQAAIPCALVGKQLEPSLAYKRKSSGKWIALMVPGSFRETARQLLRTEIEEPSAEQDYARHFVEFSDQELADIDIQTLPEGARKWYRAELEQRGLQPAAPSGISQPRPEAAGTADGFVPVATLLREEADAASRVLERASIPCRVERDAPQGDFDSFAILVPASQLDDASEVLNRHEGDIFKQEPPEGELAADDRS